MKLTIKEKYEKSNFPKLRAGIDLIRPMTIVPAFVAGFFISLLAMIYTGHPITENWRMLIYAGVTLAALQGAGQAINQSHEEEIKIDKINGKGKYRPIPLGILSKEDGIGIGIMLLFIGITRGFLINVSFGVAALVIAFFAVFYTFPLIRAKRFLLINNLWQAFSRGFLPIVACWSIFGNPFSLIPVTWGIFAMLFAFSGQVTKDIPDIKGDSEYDIDTIPVKFGKKAVVPYMIVTSVVSYIFLTFIIYKGIIPITFSFLYITLPVTIFMISTTNKKINKLENNLGWVLFYSNLGLIFLVPPLVKVLSLLNLSYLQ